MQFDVILRGNPGATAGIVVYERRRVRVEAVNGASALGRGQRFASDSLGETGPWEALTATPSLAGTGWPQRAKATAADPVALTDPEHERPQAGSRYRLIGDGSEPCIANGASWRASRVTS